MEIFVDRLSHVDSIARLMPFTVGGDSCYPVSAGKPFMGFSFRSFMTLHCSRKFTAIVKMDHISDAIAFHIKPEFECAIHKIRAMFVVSSLQLVV